MSFSQVDKFKKNTWLSLVIRHNFSDRYSFTFDLGYRTFDEFINKKRQELYRGVLERKLKKNHFIGAGLSYFETISINLNTYNGEFRPFLQYQYSFKDEKYNYNFRFRNELRNYFNSNETIFRTRLQFFIDYEFNRLFFPRIFIEEFLSVKKSILFEQRYGLLNTFKLSDKINFNIFYTLQFQSSLKTNNNLIPQNIFGLQLIVNTN